MEDKTYLQSPEDLEEDALSLCDLSIYDVNAELEEPNSFSSYSDSPSRPDLFEFSTANPTIKNDAVIFCGRVINQKHQQEEEHPRRRVLWGSESFNKSQKFHSARITGHTRSSSLSVPATGSFRYQKCESKKHKVIIGLAKIQPQMELSEIRKRQARRGPVPMIPVVVDGREPVIVGGGDGGRKSGGTGPAKSPWALLRCRAHFASVLARATSACFPLL